MNTFCVYGTLDIDVSMSTGFKVYRTLNVYGYKHMDTLVTTDIVTCLITLSLFLILDFRTEKSLYVRCVLSG